MLYDMGKVKVPYSARPTVSFVAAWHHRPLTGAKLYCLVTEVHVCQQLAQSCYLKAWGWKSTRDLFSHKSNAPNITPPE